MNTIKVMGGLGNQLFQYAFGKIMTLSGIPVQYDLHWFSLKQHPNIPRPYRLDKFQTNVLQGSFIKKYGVIKDHRVGYDPSILKLDNHNYDGYWQFKQYYENILPTLRQEFQLRPEFCTKEYQELASLITESESIAVHVRRGDYLKQTWGILPTEYYYEAIKESPKGPLFVFSDDIPWCKNTIKGYYFNRDVYFIETEDYLSFGLMRLCRHMIMASSTFSWWAAFLNEGGNIIVPSTWLGEEEDPYKYHYLKHWKTC